MVRFPGKMRYRIVTGDRSIPRPDGSCPAVPITAGPPTDTSTNAGEPGFLHLRRFCKRFAFRQAIASGLAWQGMAAVRRTAPRPTLSKSKLAYRLFQRARAVYSRLHAVVRRPDPDRRDRFFSLSGHRFAVGDASLPGSAAGVRRHRLAAPRRSAERTVSRRDRRPQRGGGARGRSAAAGKPRRRSGHARRLPPAHRA